MQEHTVTVTFEGGELASHTTEMGTFTLYLDPEGRFMIYAERDGRGWLEPGRPGHGVPAATIRHLWPGLFEAAGLPYA
jgi:hypothetical protein